jgi:hypothetical protein
MRNRHAPRVLSAFLLACIVCAAAGAACAQSLPTPEQYLGFRVGTDKKIASWPQVVEYMSMAARASDRVRVAELGKSTMGNPFILLTISSPANLARLDEIRANQRRLAYTYTLEPNEAEGIIAKNPAVLLITCSIHSSELGSTQMTLELVHRLATEKSPYIQNLLDNVVFLLAPSVNPDGQVMIVDWYNKNVGTEFEFSPMPWIYHKYTGHDDNRDGFMLTQVETRLVTKLLYKDWFPLVFLDEHQMGSNGPRIFVPPFSDPINPNQDPLVLSEVNLMGMYMFSALHAAGFAGVQFGERYPYWYEGPAKNGGWWHNMVGMLTEVASARLASPIEQQHAPLYRMPQVREGGGDTPGGGGGDPRRPLAPPTDTWARANYPRPWLGGAWKLRDIVDYELTITWALLEGVAANRTMLQRNFYLMNRRSIEAGRKGDPFAYVIPAGQRDPGAAMRMLEAMDLGGVEIYRAPAAFEADGRKFDAGSYVVPMAQPFRNYAKDLLEPQKYPMKPTRPGEAPERPYDVTGWTLPLDMGVEAVEVKKSFDAKLDRVTPVPMPEGGVSSERAKKGGLYALSHDWNNSAIAVNRLLAAKSDDYEVFWAAASFGQGPNAQLAGTILVRAKAGRDVSTKLGEIGRAAHVTFAATDTMLPAGSWKLRAPRIGLYQPWTANMDEGWTRWVLEQYDFPYTTLHNDDIRAGKLSEKFEVIVFASQTKRSVMDGNRGEWVRPEYRGGVGDDGAKAIADFVRAGGTLVTLDEAAEFAIDALGLPVRNVLRGVSTDKFYCPGAILEILVDNRNPLAYGMPEESSAYFLNSPAFELLPGFTENSGRAVVRYPATNPLQSGWIGGPEYIQDKLGAVEVSYGKGRVVLLGFRAQFRAQSHATFKLLFNALHWSAAKREGSK